MLLKPIYELLEGEIDGEEIKRFGAEYQKYPLRLSFSAYRQGIERLAALYGDLGLQTEVLHFPADGRTVYADRHFPLAWDVEDG